MPTRSTSCGKDIAMFRFVAVFLLLAGALTYASSYLDQKAATHELVGTYVIVSGEKDGKAIPTSHIEGSHVTFTKDRIISTDKDSKETYVATYKLSTEKTPWVIDMVSVTPAKGEPASGLVERMEDTVRLIYSIKSGEIPTDFSTKEKQHIFVLKKNRNE
jgi:uncharacterized protein (TIGR03067 family)